jgi:hypothetical protein
MPCLKENQSAGVKLESRSPTLKALSLLLLLAAGTSLAAEPIALFEGSGNERTQEFETQGAWMLHWSTQSADSLPKIFELRLYDADSDEFLGTITQTRELGGGRKLFEDGGRYQLDVVAGNLEWSLIVSDVEADEAGKLQRRSEGASTIEDGATEFARQVSEDSFASWRPVDDSTLLLFAADDSHGYRIVFSKPCSGLSTATALMFVSAGYGSDGEIYDAIMLDDGTHCPFGRVTPTVFD